MISETGVACSSCDTIKQTVNDELLLLRTSFVEYKKRVICTDKLFKQLTAKRSQVTKVEEKLNEVNQALAEAQEQLKSTLINYNLTTEKCKSLDLEIAKVTAERDKELCDLLKVQQQKAALEDKLNTISQKHQNVQLETAEKIKKLEGKVKGSDQNEIVKLKSKFAAQGLELSMLRQQLEDQNSECERIKMKLENCKLTTDKTFKDTIKQQESELSSLRLEMSEKHTEIKTLKEMLAKTNESATQVESLIDKLEQQEIECSLLRDLVLDKHNEIESLSQKIADPSEVDKLKVKLKTLENEIVFLRQKLKDQSAINISSVKLGNITKCDSETQTNLYGDDCQVSILNTEVQNLRTKIEAMKLEFDMQNCKLITQLADRENETLLLRKEMELQRHNLESEKLKLEAGKKETSLNAEETMNSEFEMQNYQLNAQLAEKENEILLLRKELELQQLDLASAKLHLETNEKKTPLKVEEKIPENIALKAFSSEGNAASSVEIATLKLQLSKFQSEVDMKTEEIVQLKHANAAVYNTENFPTISAATVVATNVCSLNDHEITALKLHLSVLEREVELKNKEIEKLTNKNANELLSQSKLPLESNDASVAAAVDVTVLIDKISSMKLQLSNLQAEVDLKALEIKQIKEKELKDAKRHKDLIEKGRLAEARTFELVMELAQLKTRVEGKNSASQKCTQLEKILALRDTQITQLKAELKGVLASRRRDPRKPSGARSASSGRGSCETSDLDDSSTLADLLDAPYDSEADLDVGEILRRMTTVPAMVAPIEAVAPPVARPVAQPAARPVAHSFVPSVPLPIATPAPYELPPERVMQEKMLLALVQSVRSATESYEKLYGTSVAATVPILSTPALPKPTTSCVQPVQNTVSSFTVVNDWIKNVSPEIGADQRSFSDGFGSVPSSKGSVRELNMMRDTAMPGRQNQLGETSREMSTSFSGRRVQRGAGISLLPSEVVALSRQLKSVPLKSRPQSSELDCVRKSVAIANKADHFVNGKAPTMDSLCANLGVDMTSKFIDTSDNCSTSTNTNNRTTRFQVLNGTKGPIEEGSITTRKSTTRKKILPITKSFVQGMLAPNLRLPPDLNKMENTNIKKTSSDSAIAATIEKSQCVVSKTKKKRKTKVDLLFGSDDDQPSPTKMPCVGGSLPYYSDDEISIVPVLSVEPGCSKSTLANKRKLLHLSSLDNKKAQPCKKRVMAQSDLVQNSHSNDSPVSNSLPPSEVSDVLENAHSPTLVGVLDAFDEKTMKTAAPVPRVETDACEVEKSTPTFENECEMPIISNPENSNGVESVIVSSGPMNEDQALESESRGANVESNNNINVLDPTFISDTKAKNKVSEMETTGTKAKDEPDKSAIVDSCLEEVALTTTTSDLAANEEAPNCKEVKSPPTRNLEDDDSDCELVIADSAAQISSSDEADSSDDDDDKPLRLSISVQADPKVEPSEDDSDDEPLSSLLSSPSRASFPAPRQTSPLQSAASKLTIEHAGSALPICVLPPLSPTEIKRPFFYKAPDEAADILSDTLHTGGSSEQESTMVDEVPAPPPRPKLKDETGVWSRRIYATLADKETFNASQEEKVVGTPKEEALGRYLRLILNKFVISELPVETALDKTMKNMSKLSDNCIVNQMMALVIKDKGDLEPKVSGEMQTTPKVRKLIMVIVAHHQLRPMLTDLMLTTIERRICHLSYKPPLDVMQRMLSLHLGVCLRLRLSERQRTLLYDVLYCFTGESMIPVCSHILETAPFSLKHAFMGQDDVVSLTVAYALQFGKCQKPLWDKMLPQLVSKQYKYDKKLLPSAPQLIEKMVHLLKDGDTDFVEACLVLLSKRLGWVCANSLVVSQMRRVIERWQYAGMPLCAAIIALRVIAFVVRTIPKAESELTGILFNCVSELLRCDKPEIHETVLRSLMMMAREKHFSTVVDLLQNHEGATSEDFTAAATAYVAKVASWEPKRIRRPPERYIPDKANKGANVKEKGKAKTSAKLMIKPKKNLAKKKSRNLRRREQKNVTK